MLTSPKNDSQQVVSSRLDTFAVADCAALCTTVLRSQCQYVMVETRSEELLSAVSLLHLRLLPVNAAAMRYALCSAGARQ